MTSPVARIFLSSTFRDFGEERDLLVRRVFPALRARLKERFVELVDVDLRWGITAEQAERGEVLPICLAEIDRARPWFVCMLGDRYGWVPEADAYDPDLVEQRPWLDEHRGGKSVTELEILHGVLNDPAMAGRALFYFRDPAYACQKSGDYTSASSEDAIKLEDLKNRIRASGFPVVEGYPTPEALADRLEADLWAVLDEAFPAEDVPDPFTREQRKHEAYAAPRRRLYFGGDAYKAALTAAFDNGAQRVLITGQSGGGKSALIANWLEGYKAAHPADRVHAFYLGASGDASTPVNVVRHLIEHIKRAVSSDEDVAGDPQAMFESLPTWLAYASAHAYKENYRWIVALDGLNGLSYLRDLRWWPEFLPARVHIAVSCLPGAVFESLKAKGEWHEVVVEPLNTASARDLLRAYLAQYNKTLAADLEERALAHPMAINPLFLRTLAEELRLFGSHEELSARLDHCLQSITVDDLFERVLERVEKDCGRRRVETVMTAIWASRAGLTEQEILAYAKLVPATWAPIRFALENALLESGGRITFAHDYMRIAVSDRYMAGNNTIEDDGQSSKALTLRRKEHEKLAKWFEQLPADERVVEELPYQWRQAKAWGKLTACLTQRTMFKAICEHCTDEELLGYWLDLERETGANILACYQAAWTAWEADETVIETGDLANYLQAFLSFSGRYSLFSIMLAKLSFELNEKFKGADNASTGTSLSNLAMLFADMGDYAAAEPLYRRALAIAEKAQGPEHPSVSERLNNLALLLMDMGDHTAAEPLVRRALAISEKTQGPEHSNTGNYLNTMAGLLSEMGENNAAEPLFRRALAISEKTQGPEHSNTGNCLCNLAGLLKDMGDYAAAEPLNRRALAIAEKAQGPEHPSTGTSLNNLASLLKEMGDYASAEPLYRRALAIAEKAEGPEHPSTGASLNSLASLLQDMGDYAAAEPLFRRAIAIAEKAQGPEHPSTGTRLNNLASLLKEIGDCASAEPLLRRALAIAEKAQGPEHPSTGISLHNLASLLADMGDYASAEPLYRRALTIREAALGNDHPAVGSTLYSLGHTLAELGQDGEAELCFKRELAIVEKDEGRASASFGMSLYNIGNFLAERERFEEAQTLLRQELEITKQIDGPQSESLAASHHNLGVRLRKAGRLDEAEEDLQQALAIREKLDPSSPELSYTLSAIGKVYAIRGNKAKARSYFDRSIQILHAQNELDQDDISDVEERIAELDRG